MAETFRGNWPGRTRHDGTWTSEGGLLEKEVSSHLKKTMMRRAFADHSLLCRVLFPTSPPNLANIEDRKKHFFLDRNCSFLLSYVDSNPVLEFQHPETVSPRSWKMGSGAVSVSHLKHKRR